ncbi:MULTISPECIES: sirohydrochlorin cobaltochelatase [Aerococcus]|uniref:sirohydrochlorin cobaltochelatase n=1 Tax=Aerococcus TaxID=1375 RepID=UPI0018A7A5AB|nr:MULTISPECIES: sirohydrochlorin cobaltochelatase [Aerococcus]MCY3035427.1 sirohydrochlorin cobaltochelatase [Aerococcus sp. Group 2]MCY3038849.1 sirohydrochlorin cobaltochelatase [Aerococcus sp. Group 2]MCY3041004.1 sirohydrochlorin cobaltochelatase [Aerococcus sp. Group 2]MCY3042242.1 sirohydrochlorin cobaltochelatase [Aerococcus sp. Group 2]MDK6520437.1 sirohydrochlorin cobaltochelatase [Aerococcus urinae]
MKSAILLASFGTTFKKTRELTIETVYQELKSAYPNWPIYQAYTSNIVRKRIQEHEGLTRLSPLEALQSLKAEGYQRVYVQPLHVINGSEVDKIYQARRETADQDFQVKIARPLLDIYEDYQDLLSVLDQDIQSLAQDEVMVYMAHGTQAPQFTSYVTLDYMLADKPAYVRCVESYPELEEDFIKDLRQKGVKTVHLRPLMLVAGDHAHNDMASEDPDSWQTQFENYGFHVMIHLEGLGEDPAIRQLYLKHLGELMEDDHAG